MTTKIKKHKTSKFPDKSEYQKGYDFGFRAGVKAMDAKIGDIRLQGFLDHCLITLYLLKDKYKSADEDLAQLNKDMHDYAEMITQGFLTLDMMKKMLKDVHGIEFEVTDNREKS